MSSENRPAVRRPQNVQGGRYWPGFTITIKDDQDQPIDLPAAGWANWRAQFRPQRGSAQVVDLTVDVSQAASGIIGVSASSVKTQQMGGSGKFDLIADDGAGEPWPWVEGDIDWVQGVTRP